MAEFTASACSVAIAGTTVDGAYKYTINEDMETLDATDWADIGSGRHFLNWFTNWGGSFTLRLQDDKVLPVLSTGGAVSFAVAVATKIQRTGDVIITGVVEDMENMGDVVVNFIGDGALTKSVTAA